MKKRKRGRDAWVKMRIKFKKKKVIFFEQSSNLERKFIPFSEIKGYIFIKIRELV